MRTGHFGRSRLRTLAAEVALLGGLCGAASPALASGDMALGVTPGEQAEIAKGNSFARVVTSDDPTEVVTLAGVALRAGSDAIVRCAMEPGCLRRRAESSAGRFSRHPVAADLDGLHLDSRDLEELQRCSVGRCDLRLPEDAIRTFAREIDWSSPEAPRKAEMMFRTFLVERAAAYLARGHVGLPPYADRLNGANVAAGTELLLRRSMPGLDSAPDLREYLEKPASGLPSVLDEHLAWHRERMYRKSVISLEHVVVVRRDEPGCERILVISKKVYSSHYLEASVEVAEFVRHRADAEGLLVVAARSRTDIRRSGFSWLERLLLRRLVTGRIESELEDLRQRIEHRAEPRNARTTTPVRASELVR